MSERVICEVPLRRLRAVGRIGFQTEGREVLVVAVGDGARAWDGVCPHLGGPLLRAEVRDGRIRCPWHRYEFDARDGRCLSRPGRIWRRVPGAPRADRPFDLSLRPVPLRIERECVLVLGGAPG
jgi:nitrite reductase/ring-hydroxylating ferredoxin subunit